MHCVDFFSGSAWSPSVCHTAFHMGLRTRSSFLAGRQGWRLASKVAGGGLGGDSGALLTVQASLHTCLPGLSHLRCFGQTPGSSMVPRVLSRFRNDVRARPYGPRPHSRSGVSPFPLPFPTLLAQPLEALALLQETPHRSVGFHLRFPLVPQHSSQGERVRTLECECHIEAFLFPRALVSLLQPPGHPHLIPTRSLTLSHPHRLRAPSAHWEHLHLRAFA